MMPYENEDQFVRGQKRKLAVTAVLLVLAWLLGGFQSC